MDEKGELDDPNSVRRNSFPPEEKRAQKMASVKESIWAWALVFSDNPSL